MKTKILLSAFFFIQLLANAQTPVYQWIKQIGGSGLELVSNNGLATDGNGDIVCTGQFDSPSMVLGSFTLANTISNAYSGSYVAKYDALGNVVWAKPVSDYGFTQSSSVILDAAGNIFVAGYFASTLIVCGTFTLTNPSANPTPSKDAFIVKYDPNGNVLWAKSAGGTKNDEGTGLASDAAGNAYLTGNFTSSNIAIGTTTLTNSGAANTSELFVAKYDTNGNVVWAKTQGGAINDESYSIASDLNGNILMTGFFGQPSIVFGTTTLTANGNGNGRNLFVVKYDGSGNVLWAKGGDGTGKDYGRSVTTDGSGNVLVTGSFASSNIIFGSTTLTNTTGTGHLFVVKYDSGGNAIWAKGGGGGDIYSIGLGIACNTNGDVALTGVFSGPSISFGTTTVTNTNLGSQDMYVVRYDANGNVIWAKSGGGSEDDAGNSVAIDANLDVWVAGAFQSPTMVLGTTTLTNITTVTGINHTDAFVLKIGSSMTNIGKNDFANDFSVFPNPVSTQLTIESGTTDKFTSELFDLNGHKVAGTTANTKASLNLQDYSGGMYILKITNDKGVITKKVIVEKK